MAGEDQCFYLKSERLSIEMLDYLRKDAPFSL
jgi:hypothetical protein